MKEWLISIWLYRSFIVGSIKREIVSAFARNKLGGVWSILNPLAQVLIYALILSNVLGSRMPNVNSKYAYAIYLMAGTLAWNLNSELINRGLNLFTSNAGVLKKISFPKIALPCIAIGTAVVNSFLLFVAIAVIFFILGQSFNANVLWIFPLTFVVVLFGISVGLIFGVINVFLRDIGQFIPILLQVWFWFTPVVYPASVIPQKYHQLMLFNPMYLIVEAYHSILFYGTRPNLHYMMYVGLFSLFLLSIALFLFKRSSAEMVDVL